MTLRFLRAISLSLQFEGEAYTNDPDDAGGATRYGLTWKFLSSHIGANAIHPRELTLDDALGIYWAYIWQPQRFDEYADAEVAMKVFDMALPMGEPQAVKYLQRVLHQAGEQSVKIDGRIGPQTLGAVAEAKERRLPIVDELITASKSHYLNIIQRKPSQAKFRGGWLRRATYDPRRFRV